MPTYEMSADDVALLYSTASAEDWDRVEYDGKRLYVPADIAGRLDVSGRLDVGDGAISETARRVVQGFAFVFRHVRGD